MKLSVIATMALLALAGAAFGQTFTAPAEPVRPITKPQPPPPITARDLGGVLPTAARSGNPGQMLNPRANPARYGTAEQHVMLKPDGSGKWNGIRLFVVNF